MHGMGRYQLILYLLFIVLNFLSSYVHKIILCFQWHKLDKSEQAKYYEMAREERTKHMQMYPGWSARDNYAIHKKRKKKKSKQQNESENGMLVRVYG